MMSQKKISGNFVLKQFIIGMIFLIFPICVVSSSEEDKITLRISVASKEGSSNARLIDNFEQFLEKKSPGTFEIKRYFLGKGALPQGTELKAMNAGEIELGFLTPSDFHNAIEEHKGVQSFNGIERRTLESAINIQMMPFLTRDQAHMESALRVLDNFIIPGIKPLGGIILGSFYHGRRVVTLASSKPMKRPEQMDKFRMPEGKIWEKVARSLGSPVYIKIPREGVEEAIKHGEIKAMDMPLASFEDTGFSGFFSQIVETNHLYHYLYFTIAKNAWEKMTKEQRQIVMEAAKEAIKINNIERAEKEKDLLKEYQMQKVVILHSDLDIKAFQDNTKKVFASKLEDPSFRNLYETIRTL